jgi:O-antigen ligase
MQIVKHFSSWQKNYKKRLYLLSNYLFVLYAFFLPFAFDLSHKVEIAIIILFFLSGDLKKKLFFIATNSIMQAILLFYAIYVLWLFGTQHLDIAIWKIKEYRYLLLFGIYITMVQENFKEKILSGFIFAIFLSELVSYSMMLNITPSFITITGFGDNVPFFYTYSQYVLLLSLSLGLVLYRLLSKQIKSKLLFTIYIIFFIGSSLNIFMLGSKLGYFLYVVSIATVLFSLKREAIKPLHIIILTLTIMLSYYLAYNYSSLFQHKITNIKKELHDSKNGYYDGGVGKRIIWNILSLEIIKEHPIIGIGTSDHINALKERVNAMAIKPKDKKNLLTFINKQLPGMSSLHSEYLDHLVQFGMIGLIIMLNIFYQIFKAPSSSNTLKVLRLILLSNFLLYFFVNYFFVLSQLGKIFFFLIALSTPSFLQKKKESSSNSAVR